MTDRGSRSGARGNPPVEYRWQKGCPSPNPGGRPRKTLAQRLKDDHAEMLARPVLGKLGGKTVSMPASAASFRNITNQAIRGDLAAIQYVLVCVKGLQVLLDEDAVQDTRGGDAIRKLIALVEDDPAERERLYQVYHLSKKKRRRR